MKYAEIGAEEANEKRGGGGKNDPGDELRRGVVIL